MFLTNFTKKAELFNSYFAKESTAIDKGINLPSEVLLKIDTFLSNMTFSSNDIRKIIQNLDSEKARGYDERIIIGMFKIYGPLI